MNRINYEIVENIAPDDPSWKDWKFLVQGEGWLNGPDHSTLALLPQLSQAVVARRKEDGKFLGSVVWTENDHLAYIAFYIVRPDFRGLGIGSALWKRALERITPGCTVVLRAVENMVELYKATDTPVDGPSVYSQQIRADDLMKIIAPRVLQESRPKLVSDLSVEEYEAMLSYVHEVSGQDRSRLLRLHFALDFTEGAVLMDTASRILAFASVTTTGAADGHVFKVSPVYAEGLNEALSVIYPLLHKIYEQDKDAIALISTWSGSAGEQLRPLLQEKSIHSKTSLYTLYSRPFTSTMDFSRTFVAHNHAAHFDA